MLSAVLSLSLVNLSALSMSLAGELSGYEIGVEYTQDNTSATLTGNTSGVREGVQLDKLVDSDGQELDPAAFSQTVEENGTYHFTLHYLETVAAQDGTEETTEEKTQELEIVVDGIVKPESQENPAADTGTEAVEENVPDLVSNAVEAAKTAVPVEILQRSMATALAEGRATDVIRTKIYSSDNRIFIREYDFAGGRLDAASLPTEQYRVFEKAVYKYNNASTEFTITGLYLYDSVWYYTTSANGDLGSLGYRLPTGVGDGTNQLEIRLYYKVENDSPINITTGTGVTTELYSMVVNGKAIGPGETTTAKAGENVVITFNKPSMYSSLKVRIKQNDVDILYTFDTANIAGTNGTTALTKLSDVRYSGLFTMPNQPVTIRVEGTVWPQNATYQYGLKSGGGTYDGSSNESGSLKIAAKSVGNNANPGVWNETSRTQDTFGGTTRDLYYKDKLGEVSKKQTAVGSFTANDRIVLTTSSNRISYAAYGRVPISITLDVYVNTPYAGQEFMSYTVALPQVTGERNNVTLEDIGITVNVVCDAYAIGTNNANQIFTTLDVRHTITIQGMVHNFKVTLNNRSTTQENFVVTQMDGVVEGTPSQNIKDTSSVYYAPNQQQNKKGTYKLRNQDAFIWAEKASETNAIWFYIKPEYGYSRPQATLANQTPGQTIEIKNNRQPDADGKYTFALYGATGADDMRPITEVRFVSEPIQFEVRYNNGRQTYKTVSAFTLADTRYYAIEQSYPTLSSGKYFAGFKLYVRDTNAQNILAELRNPKDNSLIWNSEDIIDVESVYDQLAASGKLSNTAATYRLVLEAQTSTTTTGSLINAKYQVKLQSGFDGFNNTAHVDTNFTTKDVEVKAYQGSRARLFGYEEVYTDKITGKKYLVDTSHSKLQGRVENANTPFATLRYLLATQVQVDKLTLGTGNNGTEWNQSQADVWYNSSNYHNHGFDLNGLRAGTKNNQVFSGWEIWVNNQKVAKVDGSMMYGSNLNFYVMGVNAKSTWQKIFDVGMFTLKATWRATSSEVYSTNGSKENMPNDDYYIKEGDTSFELKATFQYGDSTVTEGKLREMLADGTLQIVLVRKDGPYGSGTVTNWQVRYGKNNSGSLVQTFGVPTITKEDNSSNFTVSFTVDKNLFGNWNEEAHFRIFAWTPANSGVPSNLSATTIANALTAADTAAGADGTAVNPYTDVIPSVDTKTYVLFKVKDSGGTTTSNQTETKVIYDGVGSFDLSATFYYNDSTADSEKIERMIEGDLLKVALLKKNPTVGSITSSEDWEIRYGDGTATFGEPAITMKGREVTISFTVDSNVTGRWNDGAAFRILVWTDANIVNRNEDSDSVTSVTANDVMRSLNTSTGNPYEGTIPSMHFDATMRYQVINETNPPSDTLTLSATDTSIKMENIYFMYDYDASRYPSGYNGSPIKNLFGSDITVRLECLKKGTNETWKEVSVSIADVLSVKSATEGRLKFSSTYEIPEGESIQDYDGAQFRITVQGKANTEAGTEAAVRTLNVTVISDPYVYVEIPKYIILDDNSSNVVNNQNIPQDGYAGKQVTVKYNEKATNASVKPDITVKVQDGVTLHKDSTSRAEMSDMLVQIYDNGGKWIPSEAVGDEKYSTVGTLSSSATEIPFWMNVKRSTERNQQYYTTVKFLLELGIPTTD